MGKLIFLPDSFIENFLLEFQSRSGLSINSKISQYYAKALSIMRVPKETSLEQLLNKFINSAMIIAHQEYCENKTWNSYDW